MKNIIKLSQDIIDHFMIDDDAALLKITTNADNETIVRIEAKHQHENDWNKLIDSFKNDHPIVKVTFDDSYTIKAVVPEFYDSVRNFNLAAETTVTNLLPGNLKSIEVKFDQIVSVNDFKYYAMANKVIEADDVDWSSKGNSMRCKYGMKVTALTLISNLKENKSIGIINVIDHSADTTTNDIEANNDYLKWFE